MDKHRFWRLIEAARAQAPRSYDAEAVAREATLLLAARPVEEIVAADQVMRGRWIPPGTSPSTTPTK
ncbi:DUF4240 domain-containing protein [Streptomyces sp. SID2563]|uniref:DUF4240 domain-containing protein n=1 Tax=Streptomyces sp. SID2563 TaxID=2690255 RepID=UPI001F1F6FFF|nr:DUF4240 domain-containing protein [Streptomyces sp. SID2563]